MVDNIANSERLKIILSLLLIMVNLFYETLAHGRMEMPAARNCAWRYGFGTPVNYNDLELNCGGLGVQHFTFGGQCGVCGDSMHLSPRPHEAGGKYATGFIVKYYQIGDVIDVKIYISANHAGYMEFRLCPVNNALVEATQECLDRNILPIVNHGTRYPVKVNDKELILQIKLPNGLSCSRCVLQWKYRAGNNWGTESNLSGLGYGAQEEFYNCADISIGSGVGFTTLSTLSPTSTTTKSTTTTTSTKITTTATTTKSTTEDSIIIPILISAIVPIRPHPTSTSTISTTTIDYRHPDNIKCIVTEPYKNYDGMEGFCIKVCSDPTRECPGKFCLCHGINALF